MAEGDTLPNALIGAVVGVILSPLPFSTVLGGAVAGYLQGGDREDGLRVGAFTGALMLVPMVLFMFVLGGIFSAFAFGGGMMGMPGMGAMGMASGLTAIAILMALLFGLVYVVAFAAVGGYLGNYVKYDTDIDI